MNDRIRPTYEQILDALRDGPKTWNQLTEEMPGLHFAQLADLSHQGRIEVSGEVAETKMDSFGEMEVRLGEMEVRLTPAEKPTWSGLFGMDPDYNKEEMERERQRLFEVFKAGWKAGRRTDNRLNGVTVMDAFDTWLQEQVSDVDVLGRNPERSLVGERQMVDLVERLKAGLREETRLELNARIPGLGDRLVRDILKNTRGAALDAAGKVAYDKAGERNARDWPDEPQGPSWDELPEQQRLRWLQYVEPFVSAALGALGEETPDWQSPGERRELAAWDEALKEQRLRDARARRMVSDEPKAEDEGDLWTIDRWRSLEGYPDHWLTVYRTNREENARERWRDFKVTASQVSEGHAALRLVHNGEVVESTADPEAVSVEDFYREHDLFTELERFIERPPAWGPNPENGQMMLDMAVEDFQADMRRIIAKMRARLSREE